MPRRSARLRSRIFWTEEMPWRLQKAQGEKYAPEPLKQAQELLAAANEARSQKDPVKFSQTCRLARAYAELAKAAAELKAEEERLAVAQEELQKARADLDHLRKGSP